MKKAKFRSGDSLIVKSFQTLDPADRFKLAMITMLQVFSGLLDLAGVAVIGAIGALAVNGVQSRQPEPTRSFVRAIR